VLGIGELAHRLRHQEAPFPIVARNWNLQLSHVVGRMIQHDDRPFDSFDRLPARLHRVPLHLGGAQLA
jgi:hypothetical protein